MDLVELAHITFEADHHGSIAFIAVTGQLDFRHGPRDGSACAEFSRDGFDETSPISGRGRVAFGAAERLAGHVFIHNGDDSGFVSLQARDFQPSARGEPKLSKQPD